MTITGVQQGAAPRRILVVEDETVAALSIRTVLVADGHAVDIAADGEQALGMFSGGGGYDLVITDFKLAKLDGLELAQVIKQVSPATPIILITAYADKLSPTGTVSNVDVVVNKPFSVAQLQAALSKILQTA